jgi:hypothetical protein
MPADRIRHGLLAPASAPGTRGTVHKPLCFLNRITRLADLPNVG